MELATSTSTLAVAGLIVALASLLLNVFIVPGGIYLMRAFVREEIKVHDGTEHAHPNLKSQDLLGAKLDNLSRSVTTAFENLAGAVSALRLELSESMANAAKERREDIEKSIREHEERENENQRRIIEEAKAIAVMERRSKR